MRVLIKSVALAACMFMSAAHADVAYLDFDVVARGHSIQTGVGPRAQWSSAQLTEHFDLRVSIGLDDVVFLTSDTSAASVGVFWLFARSEMTSTPYSSALIAKLPANVEFGNWVSLDTTLPNFGPDYVPNAVDTFFQSSTDNYLSTVDGQQTTSVHYTESLILDPSIAPVSLNGLQQWTNADLVAYWRSLVGQTFSGAYRESYEKTKFDGMWDNGKWVGSSDILSDERETYTGDVTLRSVTVVPEPATWLLMGLGLPVVAAVRRRQVV